MSWQLPAFALLALVLAGGVWWYERSRPPARLVALVAALAALAVAGRLVFAPVPNVVATTDIAVITGFALGAAPGFAVGALAAPISNIWLGQGPWTVWQMAGWGLAGLLGAWLSLAARRRIGRLGLALACAAAGLLYGALLDLYTMVGYGGEQSLDRYLALASRAMPFNIAHALGNFAIAFAAGPALVEMISRYRTRSRFTWRPAGAMPISFLAIVAAGAALAAAGGLASPEPARAASAATYLERTQNSDGGFAATPGQPSSPAMTGWVMLGLEGAGLNPLDVREGGKSPVAYLRANIGRLRSVGDLERTILALDAAGIDPRRFAGRDLVADLRRKRDRDGSVSGEVNLTAFFVLAMRAAGATASELARPVSWLRRAQGPNGGWGFRPGAASDADSTGATLQALAAANGGAKTIRRGVSYLRRAQTRSGGFALAAGGAVNSQSTAWAAQGLAAAGARGAPLDDAIAWLRSRRARDGHYRYSAASDQTPVWVTAQVVLAVNARAFPLAAVPRAPREQRGGEPTQGAAADGGAQAGSVGAAGESAAGDGGDPALGALEGAGRQGAGGGGPNEDASAAKGEQGVRKSGVKAGPEASERGGGVAVKEPLAAEADPSAAADDGGDSDAAPWVAGGLAALAAALAGGYLLYRRRLP